jgi:hypothetical protein
MYLGLEAWGSVDGSLVPGECYCSVDLPWARKTLLDPILELSPALPEEWYGILAGYIFFGVAVKML